jgi:HEAT repeat protein
MLVRLAQNDVSAPYLVNQHRGNASGAWRAVAARAAIDRSSVLLRRRWFEDPDERVRRAALEAASVAPEASDLPELLEAVRLDPDPLSRSLAARAVGAIGGEQAVMGLDDRFARADEPDRMAIVDAYAMPAAFAAGGERELRSIAEGKQGVVSLAAASALLRRDPRDGGIAGLLVSAIDHGTEEERRLALVFLPLGDPRAAETLERAAKDPNVEVSVIALARLLELPEKRALAEKRLRELAAKDGPAGPQARAALAMIGDRSVVAALVRDVERGHPFRRQNAALALFRLGEISKAARAFADSDPGVRIAVSCGVLAHRTR